MGIKNLLIILYILFLHSSLVFTQIFLTSEVQNDFLTIYANVGYGEFKVLVYNGSDIRHPFSNCVEYFAVPDIGANLMSFWSPISPPVFDSLVDDPNQYFAMWDITWNIISQSANEIKWYSKARYDRYTGWVDNKYDIWCEMTNAVIINQTNRNLEYNCKVFSYVRTSSFTGGRVIRPMPFYEVTSVPYSYIDYLNADNIVTKILIPEVTHHKMIVDDASTYSNNPYGKLYYNENGNLKTIWHSVDWTDGKPPLFSVYGGDNDYEPKQVNMYILSSNNGRFISYNSNNGIWKTDLTFIASADKIISATLIPNQIHSGVDVLFSVMVGGDPDFIKLVLDGSNYSLTNYGNCGIWRKSFNISLSEGLYKIDAISKFGNYTNYQYNLCSFEVDNSLPEIIHIPYREINIIGDKIVIQGTVDSHCYGYIKNIKLFYKMDFESAYKSYIQNMLTEKRNYNFEFSILPEETDVGDFYYYIVSETDETNAYYGDKNNPVIIPINQEKSFNISPLGKTITLPDGNPYDGEIKLQIPKGALLNRINITLKQVDKLDKIALYKILPENISFLKPVKMELLYFDLDNDGIVDDANIMEDNLKILWWDGYLWRHIISNNDINLNIIAANINKTGLYAISHITEIKVGTKSKYLTPNNDGINDFIFFDLRDKNDKIIIFDIMGNIVKRIKSSQIWYGKNSYNEIVESGGYIYQIKTKGKIVSGIIIIAR